MAFPLKGDDAARHTPPTPIPDPYWVAFSRSCAELIDIPLANNDFPTDPKWLELLSGNSLETEPNQFTAPIASAYSGHQFGVWAGQLGDGRAILLGDIGIKNCNLKEQVKQLTRAWVMAELCCALLLENSFAARPCTL